MRLNESGNTYRVTFLCDTTEDLIALSDEHTEYMWIGLEDLDNHDFIFMETKNMLKKALS